MCHKKLSLKCNFLFEKKLSMLYLDRYDEHYISLWMMTFMETHIAHCCFVLKSKQPSSLSTLWIAFCSGSWFWCCLGVSVITTWWYLLFAVCSCVVRLDLPLLRRGETLVYEICPYLHTSVYRCQTWAQLYSRISKGVFFSILLSMLLRCCLHEKPPVKASLLWEKLQTAVLCSWL